MLALGLALLSIVDVQATSSATERTRDRGFNLAESVPHQARRSCSGAARRGARPCSTTPCGDDSMAFEDTLGSAAAPSRAAL